MDRQHPADFINCFDQRLAEFFMLKVIPHPVDNTLPELFAAALVNRPITNDGDLVGSRCYKNEDSVTLPGLVHCELLKFFPGNHDRIGVEFAALNIDTNLAGSLRLRFTDRAHNSFMLKPAEKFFCSHLLPA